MFNHDVCCTYTVNTNTYSSRKAHSHEPAVALPYLSKTMIGSRYAAVLFALHCDLRYCMILQPSTVVCVYVWYVCMYMHACMCTYVCLYACASTHVCVRVYLRRHVHTTCAFRTTATILRSVCKRQFWASVPMGPPDKILASDTARPCVCVRLYGVREISCDTSACAQGLTEAFNKDTFPMKMNLGAGAYRDGEGKVRNIDDVGELVTCCRLCSPLC
jgi:hypothetical protein